MQVGLQNRPGQGQHLDGLPDQGRVRSEECRMNHLSSFSTLHSTFCLRIAGRMRFTRAPFARLRGCDSHLRNQPSPRLRPAGHFRTRSSISRAPRCLREGCWHTALKVQLPSGPPRSRRGTRRQGSCFRVPQAPDRGRVECRVKNVESCRCGNE